MTVPRLAACGLVCAALALVSPSAAGAAGAPLPSRYSGKVGVVAPGGSERLVTRRAGRDTLVVAVRRGDRSRVLRQNRIAGRWAIPAATLQGGTTGLSADGGTLALGAPVREYPPSSSPLAIVDARTLTIRRTVTLPGFFTIDAISPDGNSLFLIQYADSNDPLDYRVRTMDTRTGRLSPRDVVDPREPDEQMGGLPMTRAMSRDGRWVYTLYTGGEETFIHALDTVGRTAACIDLEMIPPSADISNVTMRFADDGRRVVLRNRSGPIAFVDTRTFAVREPGEEPAPPPAPASAPRPAAANPPAAEDSGFPWPVLAIGALVVGLVTTRRRRANRT